MRLWVAFNRLRPRQRSCQMKGPLLRGQGRRLVSQLMRISIEKRSCRGRYLMLSMVVLWTCWSWSWIWLHRSMNGQIKSSRFSRLGHLLRTWGVTLWALCRPCPLHLETLWGPIALLHNPLEEWACVQPWWLTSNCTLGHFGRDQRGDTEEPCMGESGIVCHQLSLLHWLVISGVRPVFVEPLWEPKVSCHSSSPNTGHEHLLVATSGEPGRVWNLAIIQEVWLLWPTGWVHAGPDLWKSSSSVATNWTSCNSANWQVPEWRHQETFQWSQVTSPAQGQDGDQCSEVKGQGIRHRMA